jgi:hypothetical protein
MPAIAKITPRKTAGMLTTETAARRRPAGMTSRGSDFALGSYLSQITPSAKTAGEPHPPMYTTSRRSGTTPNSA